MKCRRINYRQRLDVFEAYKKPNESVNYVIKIHSDCNSYDREFRTLNALTGVKVIYWWCCYHKTDERIIRSFYFILYWIFFFNSRISCNLWIMIHIKWLLLMNVHSIIWRFFWASRMGTKTERKGSDNNSKCS